ncbi:farnesyl pyrophosphate synthase-like [Schistocerca nitens]|uniref:farnesyl pyrophosphate synthase-like n=1 Tax=Schistocerca cancellata TaxID=274614 RepID=UPI002117589A|nr:farnesyl pyrophosphate synthase-like [Schistocerca cancellata]XP_049815957.1 farnesyl pyrophosphate synthase-like [Schistocerca nitens]
MLATTSSCVRRLAAGAAAAGQRSMSSGLQRKTHQQQHQARRLRYSNWLASSALGRRVAPAALDTAASKEDVLEFNRVFPDVVRDLTETGRHLDAPSATKRFAKVLQYNMTGGKKNRGLAVVLSYRLLARHEELASRNTELAHIMGWALEMLHTSLLMTQDTLDEAKTRRGKPCWYLLPEFDTTPQTACNDATLLQTGLFQLLATHFRNQPYYLDVVDLFHDVSHKAVIGQLLDIETRRDRSLKLFTMDRYYLITKYKTAYHTFQMPVSLALYMAGIQDPEIHRQAKTILMEMGKFYQVMDDFLDCYGDPALVGPGTDIQDGKCTWLAVVALQRASDQQRRFMQECYGSKEPEKVEAVRQLYDELGLPATYKSYEEQSYELLCTQIQQISRGLPHKLFFKFLEKIYVKDP